MQEKTCCNQQLVSGNRFLRDGVAATDLYSHHDVDQVNRAHSLLKLLAHPLPPRCL
jgi:hypothetical protein